MQFPNRTPLMADEKTIENAIGKLSDTIRTF